MKHFLEKHQDGYRYFLVQLHSDVQVVAMQFRKKLLCSDEFNFSTKVTLIAFAVSFLGGKKLSTVI